MEQLNRLTEAGRSDRDTNCGRAGRLKEKAVRGKDLQAWTPDGHLQNTPLAGLVKLAYTAVLETAGR